MSNPAAMGCGTRSVARPRVRTRAGCAVAMVWMLLLLLPNAAHAEAPTASFVSWTGVTGTAYQLSSGTTMYANTNQSGSFDVRVTTDGSSVMFPPSIGAGWTLEQQTGSPPGEVVGRYSWTAGAGSPGLVSIIAANGLEQTTVPVTITADSAGPTLSGSFLYPTFTGDSTISVSYKYATDAGVGLMASRLLQRKRATLAGGICGAWDPTWTTIATNPTNVVGSTLYTDNSIVTGSCYRYQYVLTDVIGNTSTYTQAPNPDMMSDSSKPVGGSVTVTSGWNRLGSVDVSFDHGSDPESGIRSWRIERREAPLAAGSCGDFTAFSTLDEESPASPYVDATVVSGTCYRYRVVTVNGVNGETPSDTGSTLTVKVDLDGPSGTSIDVPSAWVNTSTVSVPFNTGVDSLSGIASWIIRRRDGVNTTGTCTGLGSWSAPLGTNPAAPYRDGGLTHGTCHEYRITVTDGAGNSTTVSTSGSVSIDSYVPTGSVSGPSAIYSTAILSGVVGDALSGVSSARVMYSGPVVAGVPLYGTACASDALAPYGEFSCNWNAAAFGLPDGDYTLMLEASDAAGNSVVASVLHVIVDYDDPIASIASIEPVTGGLWQHASGSTLWVNSYHAGSATVTVAASDSGTGVDHVDFPDVDGPEGIWLPGGARVSTEPWSLTYAWTPNSVGAASGLNITVTDGVGHHSPVPFTVAIDNSPPGQGTVSSPNGATSQNHAVVTFAPGIDGDEGSGVANWRLERSQTPYVARECGNSWTAPAVVTGARPASPIDNGGLADGFCYRYQIVTVDQVGNTSTKVATDLVKVDKSAPVATNTHLSGSSTESPVSISGDVADASSGVKAVMVRYSGPGGINGTACNDATPSTIWGCAWSTASLPDGMYTLTVWGVDMVNNTLGSDVVTHKVNHVSPVVSFAGIVPSGTPATSWLGGTTIHYKPSVGSSVELRVTASDGNDIETVTFPTLVGGTGWSAGGVSPNGVSPFAFTYSWGAGAGDPAPMVITASDGERSGTTTVDLAPDTTVPTSTLASFPGIIRLIRTVPMSWTMADADVGDPVTTTISARAASAGEALPGSPSPLDGFTNVQATSGTFVGQPGYTYCFSAIATDGAANASTATAERCTAVPLTVDQLTAGGRWSRSAVSSAYGGFVKSAKATGASLSFPVVSARRISLIATTCETCGTAKVMLGSTTLATFKLTSASTKRKQLRSALVSTTPRSGVVKVVITSSSKSVIIEGLAISHA